MPRTKLSRLNRPRMDRLKGVLLERQRAFSLTNQQMADRIGVSRSTYQRLLSVHTDEWTVGQLRSAFSAVQMEIDISAKE